MISQDPGPQGPGHNLRLKCGKIKASDKQQATSNKRQASSGLTRVEGYYRMQKTNKRRKMTKKELLEDLTALANILMDNCEPKNLNKHDLQKYYEFEERIQKLQNIFDNTYQLAAMSYQKQKDELLNKLKSHLAKIDDSVETLFFSIQAYDGWGDNKLGEPIGFNEYELISLLSDSNCDMVNSALFPCNELEKFVNLQI